MLTVEQHKAKWEAIADTIVKTNNKNDKKYKEYIAADNSKAAEQMVKATAKANGYTRLFYHGTKKAGFTTLNKNKRSFAKKVFFKI